MMAGKQERGELADTGSTQVAFMPVADNISLADLGTAIAAGWQDFRTHPQYGLFFGGIFVAAGLFLVFALSSRSEWVWLIPAAAGFPILAPFAAAGLYEVSRRIETGESISWTPVLRAVRGRGDDQLPVLGVLAFVFFAIWVIIAHTIFGVFLGPNGLAGNLLTVFTSQSGLLMLATGSVVGAVLAFTFFAMTVVSMPMLVDRDVDFVSAIIVSFRAVRANIVIMLVCAAIVAILLFIAMAPLFLGLLIVLPVLGHATWHLYRRATSGSGEA